MLVQHGEQVRVFLAQGQPPLSDDEVVHWIDAQVHAPEVCLDLMDVYALVVRHIMAQLKDPGRSVMVQRGQVDRNGSKVLRLHSFGYHVGNTKL